MRKSKPRTNPDKPQNNKVNPCPYYEEHEGFTKGESLYNMWMTL